MFFLIVTLIVTLASCGNKQMKSYENGDEMAEAAKAKVNFISAADFKAVVESDMKFYLIDCRESAEFDISCIKGALNLPRGILEDEIANQAPGKRTALYIYCDNGQRSTLAASVLPALKYCNVKVIEGGFDALQQVYPELVELSPVRGEVKKKIAAPSGGCGG